MSNSSNKAVAALLRQIADQIERGESTPFDALGPTLSAVLYERRQIQRPTPIPQKPQKPDPPTIYFNNGVPSPLGIRKRVELADTKTSTYISWPHNPQQLSKFARMPFVKREFWSGSKKIYGDALRLFCRYGMVVKKGKAYAWSESYTPLARRDFAKQFYPKPV